MRIIQMAGFPGSGKSTLSKEISKRTDAVIIDKDVFKSTMLEKGLTNDVASRLAYDLMFDLGKFYLEQGRSIIFDTPCYFEEIIDKGLNLSSTYNAQYKFIDCYVDDFELISKRISLRDNMTSQIIEPTLEGFERAKKRVVRPDSGYLRIDTADPISIDYEQIINYIKGE